MAYRDHIAPKRQNPIADRINEEARSEQPKVTASEQERLTPQSTKFRTVSTTGNPAFDTGNQVRLQGNAKGTGTAGVPSAVALAGKDTTKPAVENPDGEANRPGSTRN